jgi:predicted PurR-regulated permease PerM
LSTAEYTKRLLILAVFLLIGLLLYRVADLLLIVFGTVMFAVILSSASTALHRRLHIRRGIALAFVVVLSLLGLGVILYLFGARIEIQVVLLANTLPGAVDRLKALLAKASWGPQVIDQLSRINLTAAGTGVLSRALGAVSSLAGIVTNLILIFFGSLYLAASPDLYLRGMLSLIPRSQRPRAAEVLGKIYDGLRHWLIGQFISMAVVGAAFGIALTMIGVPGAIVLGIIAALLEFIPLVGPVLATIPALLEALTQSTSTVIWVGVAFVVIQQTESNLLVPFVQKRAVQLPPVVALFATVIFGLLFGAVGLIFAVPLIVMVMIAVQEIYVKDILGGPEPEHAPDLRALVEDPAPKAAAKMP